MDVLIFSYPPAHLASHTSSSSKAGLLIGLEGGAWSQKGRSPAWLAGVCG